MTICLNPSLLGHKDGEARVPLTDPSSLSFGKNQCGAASRCGGWGERALADLCKPSHGLHCDLVRVQGRAHRLIPISQKECTQETWVAACFPAGARNFPNPFVQVAAAATETTQPDKERNSCVQLTALRSRALLLPGRLSLAKQWQRAGWFSPETGAAASGGGSQAPEAAQR